MRNSAMSDFERFDGSHRRVCSSIWITRDRFYHLQGESYGAAVSGGVAGPGRFFGFMPKPPGCAAVGEPANQEHHGTKPFHGCDCAAQTLRFEVCPRCHWSELALFRAALMRRRLCLGRSLLASSCIWRTRESNKRARDSHDEDEKRPMIRYAECVVAGREVAKQCSQNPHVIAIMTDVAPALFRSVRRMP